MHRAREVPPPSTAPPSHDGHRSGYVQGHSSRPEDSDCPCPLIFNPTPRGYSERCSPQTPPSAPSQPVETVKRPELRLRGRSNTLRGPATRSQRF